jgi:hypothetical protein
LTIEDKQELVGWLTGTKPKVAVKPEGSVEFKADVGNNGVQQRDAEFVVNGQQRRHMDDSKISKLPKFSGLSNKNEPSFRVWKFEVENLGSHYRESEVVHAIHRSVTGNAAEVLMRLGRGANLQQILQKFEHVFGSVASQEKLMTDFYTAKQKSSDSIADWSCHLEDILSHHQLIQLDQRDSMLRTRFFHGLHSDKIKNAIRHKFENGTYEELLVLAREAEEEEKTLKAVSKPQLEDSITSKLDELLKEMKDMKGKTSEWEKRLKKVEDQGKGSYKPKPDQPQAQSQGDKQNFICNYCKAPGHTKKYCKKLNSKRSAAEAKQ